MHSYIVNAVLLLSSLIRTLQLTFGKRSGARRAAALESSMSLYPHSFGGRVVLHDLGSYTYTVIFLPPELHSDLPLNEHPRLRVEGEVGEQPFEGAWQPVRGRWYVMLSRQLLRDAGLAVGDEVEVRFAVVDQNAVEVLPALRLALEADERAASAWEGLSVGKRRALAHRVLSAKTAATRGRRVAEVLETLTRREW